MAKILILKYGEYQLGNLLKGAGHEVVFRSYIDYNDITASNPDLVINISTGSNADVTVLNSVTRVGYPVMSCQSGSTSRAPSAYYFGVVGNRTSTTSLNYIKDLRNHALFEEADVTVDGSNVVVNTAYSQGYAFDTADVLYPDSILAECGYDNPSYLQEIAIAFSAKGTVSRFGETLEANVMFNGLLYSYIQTTGANTVNDAIMLASVKIMLGSKYSVSGFTLNRAGEPSAFQLRAYVKDGGHLVTISNSDPITGAYSIDPLTPESMLVCVSDDADVNSICIDVTDNSISNDFDFSESAPSPDVPTHRHVVSGTVKKLNAPVSNKVIALSSGTSKVLGQDISDPITGYYEIDVYPHLGDVILCAVQDGGLPFTALVELSIGQIIHPSVVNGRVYTVIQGGVTGDTEPSWELSDNVISGGAILSPELLYKPVIDAYVTPTVEVV